MIPVATPHLDVVARTQAFLFTTITLPCLRLQLCQLRCFRAAKMGTMGPLNALHFVFQIRWRRNVYGGDFTVESYHPVDVRVYVN